VNVSSNCSENHAEFWILVPEKDFRVDMHVMGLLRRSQAVYDLRCVVYRVVDMLQTGQAVYDRCCVMYRVINIM